MADSASPPATSVGIALASDAAGAIPDASGNAPVTTPAVENAAVPTPEVKAKAEKDGARFAAFAKKEKAIRDAQGRFQSEITAREAQLATAAAQLEAERQEIAAYKAVKAAAKLKPMEWLKHAGLTYEQLTEAQLNGGEPGPSLEVQALQDRIDAAEKREAERLEAQKRATLEATQAQRSAVVEQFRADVNDFVAENAEKYELTALYEQGSLVAQVIEENYNLTKKIMKTSDAAEAVEEYLEQQALKATATKRVQGKLKPAAPVVVPSEKAPAQPRVTLSNDMTQTSPGNISASTEKERMSRAMARLTK